MAAAVLLTSPQDTQIHELKSKLFTQSTVLYGSYSKHVMVISARPIDRAFFTATQSSTRTSRTGVQNSAHRAIDGNRDGTDFENRQLVSLTELYD